MSGEPGIHELLTRVDTQIARLVQQRMQSLEAYAVSASDEERQDLLFVINQQIRQAEDGLEECEPHPSVHRCLLQLWSDSRPALVPGTPRIACLGPAGTFSHIMAAHCFGRDSQLELVSEAPEILESLQIGHSDYGLLAVGNSLSGAMIDNLELLRCSLQSGIRAVAEHELLIHHCLMGRDNIESLRRIVSHHQAIGQCRVSIRRLRNELGRPIEITSVPSTAEAARMAAEDTTGGTAAIVHQIAGEGRSLKLLRKHFEDDASNRTRFLLLTRDHTPQISGPYTKSAIFLAFSNQQLSQNLPTAIDLLRANGIRNLITYPAPRGELHHLVFIETGLPDNPTAHQQTMDRLAPLCIAGYPIQAGTYAQAILYRS